MSSQHTKSDSFKVFPEFSSLEFANRAAFESYVSDFPPISDLSFATMMTYWNTLDAAAVSQMGRNLVISYWMPGMEKLSGLSIVGSHRVDEAICEVFDYQRSRGETPRLVNVPEQTIINLRYPELFVINEQRSHNEYIIDLKKFYPLKGMVSHRKWAVKRFIAAVGEENIIVKSIDLSADDNIDLLLDKIDELKGKRGSINKTFAVEQEAIRSALVHADKIGIQNVCIFVRGELQAFCLYDLPANSEYGSISHVRVSYDLPHAFNYAVYAFTKWFSDMGIYYLNLESDLGFMDLRVLKTVLGPSNFFRKYSIEPAD